MQIPALSSVYAKRVEIVGISNNAEFLMQIPAP
jgi:hypothetical protein